MNCLIFCPILTKFWIFSADFHNVPNIKFNENPLGNAPIHAERHKEANRHFLQLMQTYPKIIKLSSENT